MTFPFGNDTDLIQNTVYNIIYENVLYCLFVFLGPLAILIALNTCLVRELCLARRRMLARRLPAAVGGEEQEQNLTLVMIVIILIFVVCQTPAFINQLLFFVGDDTCGNAYFYYFHVSNMGMRACIYLYIYILSILFYLFIYYLFLYTAHTC